MTVLVTGSGYIGSRVIRDLVDAGHETVVFDMGRPSPACAELLGPDRLATIRWHQGDVSDSHRLTAVVGAERPEAIVHTAFAMGLSDYRASGAGNSGLMPGHAGRDMVGEVNLALALRVNSGGMLNVLEAARLFDVKRVVYTSAFASLGRDIMNFYHEPIGDRALFMPDTMYGATKILNEVMAKIYFDKHGVDSIGFRIARTYGTSHPAPLTDLLRRVAIGEQVDLPDPDYINSYIYVEDCAAAHVHACFAPRTETRVFNLREGEYSNRELLAAIQRVFPGAQVVLTDGPGDGIPTPRIDASGVARELGWRAPHSLDDGLRAVFGHWRTQSDLPPLPSSGNH
jgi:UDP-glucose 4-epimerase